MVFAFAFLPFLGRCLGGLADGVEVVHFGYLRGGFLHLRHLLVRNLLQALRQVLTELVLNHLDIAAHKDVLVHEAVAGEFQNKFCPLGEGACRGIGFQPVLYALGEFSIHLTGGCLCR